MVTAEWVLGLNEDELKEARAIRRRVFCVEQEVDEAIEIDGYDKSAIHVIIYLNEVPAATGRLLIMNDQYQIGRVAVLPEFRGKQLGALAVRMLVRAAYDMGGQEQWLHAQLPVVKFYEKLGFKTFGDIYEEAGIQHITMVHEGDMVGNCH